MMVQMFWLLFCLCSLIFQYGYSDASAAYVVDEVNFIYRVDLTNGSVSPPINSSPIGSSLYAIALADSQTAYVTDFNASLIYQVDLTSGSSSLVTSQAIPGGGLSGLALVNRTTAYTVGGDNNIYLVDLSNGNFSQATSSPVPVGAAFGVVDIALALSLDNPTTAYVTELNNNTVWRIDLTTGASFLVTPSPIPGVIPSLRGIALVNNNTSYVTDAAPGVDGPITRVDLTNGSTSLLTSITGAPHLELIGLANPTILYTVGTGTDFVYRVDLTSGAYSQVTSSIGTFLSGISLVLQIPTANLIGNSAKFTNYLNNNAPFPTLLLFVLSTDIPRALESACPTRNAISTFASQTTQFALGQLVSDHFEECRWRNSARMRAMKPNHSASVSAQWLKNPESLLADSSDKRKSFFAGSTQKKRSTFSPWVGAFGEFAHEKAQQQTPAFQTRSGGLVTAFDWQDALHTFLLGGGGAYAHTHIHEEEGAGHANIDQGALAVYGTGAFEKWYVDLALWGGYYRSHNVRRVTIPGISSGNAFSSIHGWQLAPHLEVGYDYERDWFGIEPFTMIDSVTCWEHHFQEHGSAGRLNMGQKARTCSLIRSEAGVRFNETILYGWGSIVFREKASYAYQKTFGGALTAFLIGSPGSFSVSTLTGAQNLGVGEFELWFVPANIKYPYGTLSYQGEFGSHYRSHQAMVKIGMDF
jgi:uncharacterized protein with beta-barrel porin domain